MQDLRIRTVATRADAIVHAWPRWASLVVWAVACAILTAGLVALQHLVGAPDPAWLKLYHFGPALAVAVLLLVFRDHHQRPEFVLGGRPSLRVLALAVVAVLVGGVVVVTAMAARDTLVGERTALPEVALPLVLAIGTAVVTAIGEETAWRAYLQPELERWWGPLPAAAGVGVVWGLWSALARNPGPELAIAFGITAVAMSVAIRAVLRFARTQSLLLATLCHAALNVGILLVLPGQGEERLTAWALAIAAVVVGGSLWLASCFRPTETSTRTDDEDDEDDYEDDGSGDADGPDEQSIGLGWIWRSMGTAREPHLGEADLGEPDLDETDPDDADLGAAGHQDDDRSGSVRVAESRAG